MFYISQNPHNEVQKVTQVHLPMLKKIVKSNLYK